MRKSIKCWRDPKVCWTASRFANAVKSYKETKEKDYGNGQRWVKKRILKRLYWYYSKYYGSLLPEEVRKDISGSKNKFWKIIWHK